MKGKGKMSAAQKQRRRERRVSRRQARVEKRPLPQHFNASEQVRFVSHDDHVTPPILVGLEGQHGYVVEQRQDGLYLVQFDRVKPCIQVHADQLELVE